MTTQPCLKKLSCLFYVGIDIKKILCKVIGVAQLVIIRLSPITNSNKLEQICTSKYRIQITTQKQKCEVPPHYTEIFRKRLKRARTKNKTFYN